MVLRLTNTASVQAAVAARPLLAGEVVQQSDLRYVDVGASGALAKTLLRPADVASLGNRQAARAIPAGSLVTKADLVDQGTAPQLRAMSVPIDPTHAVGGAIGRGDTVDVIDSSGTTPVFVVTGAKVVEVASTSTAKIGTASSKFSVTIAVDDASALRLAAAITAGKIDVVRSTGAAPVTAQSPTPVKR
jgi:Flp pilus assembly protein CpaB